MLAGLAFCEMLSQYPRSAFRGSAGVTRLRGGQQQLATQMLRVHLLGIDQPQGATKESWILSDSRKKRAESHGDRFVAFQDSLVLA